MLTLTLLYLPVVKRSEVNIHNQYLNNLLLDCTITAKDMHTLNVNVHPINKIRDPVFLELSRNHFKDGDHLVFQNGPPPPPKKKKKKKREKTIKTNM